MTDPIPHLLLLMFAMLTVICDIKVTADSMTLKQRDLTLDKVTAENNSDLQMTLKNSPDITTTVGIRYRRSSFLSQETAENETANQNSEGKLEDRKYLPDSKQFRKVSSPNSVEDRNFLPDSEQFRKVSSSNSVEGRNHLANSEQFRMMSSSNSVQGRNHLPDSEQLRMMSSSSSVEGRNHLPDSEKFRMMSSSNSVEGRNHLPDSEQVWKVSSPNSVEGRKYLPDSEQVRKMTSPNSLEGRNHLPESKQVQKVSSPNSVEGRNRLLEPEQVQMLRSSIHQTADRERQPPQRRGHKRQARILNYGVTRMENGTEEGTERERGEEGANGQREKRNEFHWRRPKTQFVTGTYRMTPPSSRFQLPGLQPWSRNNRRYLADSEQVRRSGGPSQRRIIYYATLPEIVRPPTTNLWQRHQSLTGLTANSPLHQHSTRQAVTNYGDTNRPNVNLNLNPNPPPKDNEIIHVSSAVIDVTNNRDQPVSPTAILTTSAIQQNGAQNGGHRIYDVTSQNGAQSGAHRNTIYDITSQNGAQHGGHRIYDVTSQNGAQSGVHRNTIYDITSQNGAQIGGHRIYDVTPQQKYTIYDMEPPYMRQPYYNNYYNLDNKVLGYDKQRYSYYYQQYQPLGQYPPHQDRFYNDVRTPPYRVHAPYQNELPPYKYPYQNVLPPYQSPPVYNDRKPEYVPIEVQTTAPSVSSGANSTTTTEATLKGVGDPRHQTSSTAESAIDLSKQGNSTNGLVSRYV